jgi:hypothetical protein
MENENENTIETASKKSKRSRKSAGFKEETLEIIPMPEPEMKLVITSEPEYVPPAPAAPTPPAPVKAPAKRLGRSTVPRPMPKKKPSNGLPGRRERKARR